MAKRVEERVSGYAYKGGIHGSLHNIKMSHDGRDIGPKVCAFTENAIAGDLLEFTLDSGAVARYEECLMFVTARKDDSAAMDLMARGFDDAFWKDERSGRNEDDGRSTDGNGSENDFEASFETSSAESGIWNAFMSTLSRQVEFCSLIKGFVQLSPNSMIGIRDVFQALEGYIYLNPKRAKEKMLEALDYVVVNGRCPRQYSLPSSPGSMPRIDLREFIDRGCWVIDCIVSYLKLTGDMGFLDINCGYIEISDEGAGTVTRSCERGTVLDHMERIMQYLLSNQDEDTGSSNVLFKTIVRYVLGFLPGYDGLTICPAAYCPYDGFAYRTRYHGKNVKVKKAPCAGGDGVKRIFRLNGVAVPGVYDKAMKTYKLLIKDEMLLDDNTIEI